MTLMQAGFSLKSLILLPQPEIPDTLLRSLVSRDMLASPEKRYMCEGELHTRLYFYDLILKRDVSAMPENVVGELRESQMACLALLLHVQWLLGAVRSAPGAVRQLLSDEMVPLPPESRQLVAAQVVHLLLENLDDPLLEAIEEARDALQLDDRLDRIVRLARIVLDFDSHQPQATIAALRELARETDASGVAAEFLLAKIYQRLTLPYEERECYSLWKLGLSRLHQRSVADLAGSVCKTNPAMEQTIIQCVARWLSLLRAGGSQSDADQVVDEFKKAGYAKEFEMFRGEQGRQPGYHCRLISPDELSDPAETQAALSDILTSCPKQGACLILRDEHASEIEHLPRAASVAPERDLLARLPDQLLQASLMVVPDVVDEGALQNRKWLICFDQVQPMDALAIGILPTESELSIVYNRSIVFETRLDQAKDQRWFQAAVRLLGQPFDAQKLSVIRAAVRRIADQISTGHSTMQVIEL